MEHISTAASTVVTQLTGTPSSNGSGLEPPASEPSRRKLPERIRTIQMREMASTMILQAQREALLQAWRTKTRPGSGEEREVRLRLARLDDQIEEAAVRDEMQANRPPNCFCLGTGILPYRLRWHVEVKPGEFCSCPDGKMAALASAEERASYEETLLARRRETIVADIGIPPHFQDFSLATYRPDPAQRQVYRQMGRWAEGDGGSVFLYGEPGRGKTGLCLAALRVRVEHEVRSGLYWNATALLTELIRGIRDTETDAPDPVVRAERVRYLVLDDIDKIAETTFKLQVIYDLVNKRHDAGRATLFTANMDLPKLSKKLGAWSVDRIREMCGSEWVLELGGANRRLGKGEA